MSTRVAINGLGRIGRAILKGIIDVRDTKVLPQPCDLEQEGSDVIAFE